MLRFLSHTSIPHFSIPFPLSLLSFTFLLLGLDMHYMGHHGHGHGGSCKPRVTLHHNFGIRGPNHMILWVLDFSLIGASRYAHVLAPKPMFESLQVIPRGQGLSFSLNPKPNILKHEGRDPTFMFLTWKS